MLQNLTGWHAILILVVVLLVFGASKLPELAKSVGQSVKILKDEVAEGSKGATTEQSSHEGQQAAASSSTSASTTAPQAAAERTEQTSA